MSWSTSARDCVKNAVKNVETELLKENHEGSKSKADGTHPAGCPAETDVTPELNDDLANRHQQLIGALRWACELGRIDVPFEISLLASHAVMPRQGHLEAVCHVFACLKQHLNSHWCLTSVCRRSMNPLLRRLIGRVSMAMKSRSCLRRCLKHEMTR